MISSVKTTDVAVEGINLLNPDPVFKTNVFCFAYRSRSVLIPFTGSPAESTFIFCVQALSEYHPKKPDNSLYCPETIFPELFTIISFSVVPSAKVSPFP